MSFHKLNRPARLSLLVLPALVVTLSSLYLLMSAVTSAAADSEPGDLLYSLRQPALELRHTLTLDPQMRAEIELQLEGESQRVIEWPESPKTSGDDGPAILTDAAEHDVANEGSDADDDRGLSEADEDLDRRSPGPGMGVADLALDHHDNNENEHEDDAHNGPHGDDNDNSHDDDGPGHESDDNRDHDDDSHNEGDHHEDDGDNDEHNEDEHDEEDEDEHDEEDEDEHD